MDLVTKDDVVEGAMFKTHMNSPEGIEHLWQKFVYILQTNGDYE